MSGPVRLEYRDVTMHFAAGGGHKVLTAVSEVSFSVRDGEVVSLIGPSGCGKSTLLNIGSGLAAPSAGEAFVDGERVEGPNAHVAFMLQKDLLLPWRTVAENVMFGAEIQGVPQSERRTRAQALLDAGLRIGSTLAVVGVVVGELVGGNVGLGYLLSFGEGQANTPMVFVSILMLTLVGSVAYLAVIRWSSASSITCRHAFSIRFDKDTA